MAVSGGDNEEMGDVEEINPDREENKCEEGEIMDDDDDDDGEQSGHDPEVDEEDNVIVDGGEAVDGEGKVIRREEPGGIIIRRKEPVWQENEHGKKKEREEKHVSGMRFWLHGNRWIDNYEKARASVRNRKLFNDKVGRK